MTNDHDGLMPCPFCGGEASHDITPIFDQNGGSVSEAVRCKKCGCSTPTSDGRFVTPFDVVSVWSTRAPTAKPDAAQSGDDAKEEAYAAICKLGDTSNLSDKDRNALETQIRKGLEERDAMIARLTAAKYWAEQQAALTAKPDTVSRAEYDAVCQDLERLHDTLNAYANQPDISALIAEVMEDTRYSTPDDDHQLGFTEGVDTFAEKLTAALKDKGVV